MPLPPIPAAAPVPYGANVLAALKKPLNDPNGVLGAAAYQGASGGLMFETWALLAADATPAHLTGGQWATVALTDSGTHTDPVVGGTVQNAGVYRYSTSPAGWKWLSAAPVDAGQHAVDVYRIGKARWEYAAANGAYNNQTQNVFVPTSWTLAGGATLNADQTFTLPAGATLTQSYINNSNTLPYYVFIMATATPPTPNAISFVAGHGYVGANQFSTPTIENFPGVYTSQIDPAAFYNPTLLLTNNSTQPVTIFAPLVTFNDPILTPAPPQYDTYYPVSSLPVVDRDWAYSSGDRFSRHMAERQATAASDSVNGSSGNAGTIYAPFNTLALLGAPAQGSLFGLRRGSTFREQLLTTTVLGAGALDFSIGDDTSFPIVSCLNQCVNGSFVNNGDGTYNYTWTTTDGLIQNNSYNYIYLVEINASLEATTRLGARNLMPSTATLAAVATTPGGCFITAGTVSGSNKTWTATIKPTDGLAPGSGAYTNGLLM